MVGMGAFHVAMVGLLQWLVGVGAGSCEKNETFCAVASAAKQGEFCKIGTMTWKSEA